MSRKLVVVTIVRQGSDENPVEKIRAEVFLDTATACANLNVKIVAVFKDCSASYLKNLKDLGVVLFKQKTHGMGAVRREALKRGVETFRDCYYLWIEPEKPNFPLLAKNIIHELDQTGAKFCFFNRKGMDSYPPEQAYYYLFCRTVASYLVGFDLNYAFGPMIVTKKTAPFFLNYSGEYGDLWDSILIPRLRIIRSGLPYVVKTVDFTNDPRMTVIESGNQKMILKRVEQLQNVIPSLIAEWQK